MKSFILINNKHYGYFLVSLRYKNIIRLHKILYYIIKYHETDYINRNKYDCCTFLKNEKAFNYNDYRRLYKKYILIKENNYFGLFTPPEFNTTIYPEEIEKIDKINDLRKDLVQIVLETLKKFTDALNNNRWYDVNKLGIIESKKFNMVIIDGPPAWKTEIRHSRYPAFPFVFNKLTRNSIVYLDDADRVGENEIIQIWEQEFNVKFYKANGTLAYFTTGNNFNPVI